jgi:hypothetical protein
MSAISDETLSAYLDGDLPPQERERIERAAAASPALRRRLADLKANDEILRRAVDQAMGPPSAALLAALAGGETPANVAPLRPRLARPALAMRWRAPLAAAAALVVGIAAGRMVVAPQPPALVVAARQGAAAGPDLARVLADARSGDSRAMADGSIRIVLSFKAQDGRLCRQFEAQIGGDARAGIACRQDGAWRLEDWTAGRAPAAGGAYVTAGGPDNPVIAAELSRLGMTATLDRDGESAAIRKGWAPAGR